MKLRNFDNFLLQEAESESHAEAAKLGLVYQGFGYYTDPRTGQITHKAEGGKLVPYSGPDARTPEQGETAPDALKRGPAQPGDPTGPRMAPGTGIAGAPEPGTEQYPRGANWNPGPNGDHCVGDQEPPQDLAYDTFVGKTNYYKWTAGKEGSNYKNIKVSTLLDEPPAKRENKEHSFFTFLSEGPMAPTEQGNPTPGGLGGQTPAEKARQLGLRSNRHGSWLDSEGNIVARTVNGELVFYEPGGGAVSDSGGGSELAMAKPTWTDPVSGMAITPPSKPETPQEIAAVPAATPAQAPAGYERFMHQRKQDLYKDQMLQQQAEQEIEQQEQQFQGQMVRYPELQEAMTKLEFLVQGLDERAADAEANGDEETAGKFRKKQGEIMYAMNSFKDEFEEFHDKHKHMGPEFVAELAQQDIRSRIFHQKLIPMNQKLDQLLAAKKAGKISKEQYDAIFEKSFAIRKQAADSIPGFDTNKLNSMNNESNKSRPKPTAMIEGEMTNYYLESQFDKYDPAADVKKSLITDAFKDQLKDYNLEPGDVGDVIEISWETKPDFVASDGTSRSAAFDALKTWRSQVLPDIPVGTIVFNNPAYTEQDDAKGKEQGARERLYSLAGFGDKGKVDTRDTTIKGQYGVVVQEGDKKKVKPLEVGSSGRRGQARKKKLKEELLFLVHDYYTESLNIMRKRQIVEEYYEEIF